MKIKISMIHVTDRIRKQVDKIDELAADVEQNGLINPITVMPSGGEYQLLAGLRRLKAAQSLGWTEIEANCVDPRDAEAALHIEYSENVQREEFTFSEKMDYARLIEEIESASAKERMSLGGQGGLQEGVDGSPPLEKKKRRDSIGEKIGMSGRQYERAKYVADNAPQDVIEALDRGDRSITGTFDTMQAAAKQSGDATASESPAAPEPAPESDLDRAIRAEQELASMQYRWHNEIYHREENIEFLKRQVASLEQKLDAANTRIQELEAKYEPSVQ